MLCHGGVGSGNTAGWPHTGKPEGICGKRIPRIREVMAAALLSNLCIVSRDVMQAPSSVVTQTAESCVTIPLVYDLAEML